MSEIDDSIHMLNAQAQQIASNLQNQRNYESDKQFEKDVLRSQMLFQTNQYVQAQQDNSIAGLARQYSEAGFNPRDAVNRQGTANPTSAPSGMSAPSHAPYDTSPVMQSLQMMHDSRLDEVERALSASKLMTDEKQRDLLTRQAGKILSDILNDERSFNLQNANHNLRVLEVTQGLELKRDDLQKRYEHLKAVLKETHNHNVMQEMTNMENTLNIINGIIETVKSTLKLDDDSWLGRAGRVVNKFSNNVSGRPLW